MAGRLTPRERQAAILAARGLTAKGVALSMGISEQTVKNFWMTARMKYDAPTTTALVARAILDGTIKFRDLAEVVSGKLSL